MKKHIIKMFSIPEYYAIKMAKRLFYLHREFLVWYAWFDYKFWNYEHTYGYEPFAIPSSDLGGKIVFAGVRFSNTKCCIERNDFFVILKAEVFG